MGGFCTKQEIPKETIETKDFTIEFDDNETEAIKTFSDNKFINFYKTLSKLHILQIHKIHSKSITFDISEKSYSDLISLYTLINTNFIQQKNFLFFQTIMEVLISIIDFIDYIIKTKEKFGLNYFSLINFDRFYLEKKKENIYQLIYIGYDIDENYKDNSLLEKDKEESSIRESYNTYKSPVQPSNSFISHDSASTMKKSRNRMNKIIYEGMDFEYKDLKSKEFSYENLNEFYAFCFIKFLTKYLIIDRQFDCDQINSYFNSIIKIVNEDFKPDKFNTLFEKISLENVKTMLVNRMLNKHNFLQFFKLSKALIKNSDNLSNTLSEYKIPLEDGDSLSQSIFDFKITNISFKYSDINCCLEGNQKNPHQYGYMNIICILDINDNSQNICLGCLNNLIHKLIPEGENKITLTEFENIILKEIPKIKLYQLLRYYYFYLREIPKEVDKKYIFIYKKEDIIIFENTRVTSKSQLVEEW